MTAGVRLTIVVAIFAVALFGWSVGGCPGAITGLAVAVVAGVLPWRRRQPWSWLLLWLGRRRPIIFGEPVTAVNDGSGGGVRYQDGIAAVAVQVLGKRHMPTRFTGSTATETDNMLDVVGLLPLLHHSLGLTLESLSVVSTGARRRSTGDYSRVYDTLIGTPPYAGRRETWLVIRIAALPNATALHRRSSVGTVAVAAAQRVSAALCRQGIRARVATATDIIEMERRVDGSALGVENRRWHSVRGKSGWLTSYAYRVPDVDTAILAQAWALRVDAVTQNVTLFPDGTLTGSVTVRTAQPPPAPPAVVLQPLPGEQARALAANFCGPRPDVRGFRCGPAPQTLSVPVGPSGVLLGRIGAGERLLLPLDDPGEFSRVHVAAEDPLVKRIVVRLAAAGDTVTVHTRNPGRWEGVRMAGVFVTDRARPAQGTTVSVIDGTVVPTLRPNTLISIGEPGSRLSRSVDVALTQTGPATLTVTSAGQQHTVEVELFRAENRYVSSEPTMPTTPAPASDSELEPAE